VTRLLRARPRAGQRAVHGIRRLMLQLSRSERRLTRAMTRDLLRLFADMGADAAQAFRGLKSDDGTVFWIMRDLVVSTWGGRLGALTEKHYARVVAATDEDIRVVLGLGTKIPDDVARAIVAEGGRRAGLIDLDGQTRAALYRALAEGRAAGDGPAALARRIQNDVAGGRYRDPRYRARLIARTETKYAQNRSSLEAYQSADAVTGVIAYDNRIGFDDDECSARDGQFFTFDDAAIETDDEHPNGTLSWGPATGGADG
jgi:hypothetical protein